MKQYEKLLESLKMITSHSNKCDELLNGLEKNLIWVVTCHPLVIVGTTALNDYVVHVLTPLTSHNIAVFQSVCGTNRSM